ncbi:hypothetical protein Mp_3g00590 [Marchantia polymorpha subsp. ruderalis]|uniref:Uncharacterized protein n=2 Tax=Marchantia polymorpha TaxID=3197 RepID=A0AAF6AVX8_MARPO|nr:hypothetical protein MARPO_0007s0055 [Marchantia polymorpha]BBN03912.1 hypothetical protein Mp_3g00590 [Marchantia polymorpha subsp. ruderalis]|eukprot:PTQ47600.1 hypothetical protein MARPO_0007s0055 [Marchantia polymorpha]
MCDSDLLRCAAIDPPRAREPSRAGRDRLAGPTTSRGPSPRVPGLGYSRFQQIRTSENRDLLETHDAWAGGGPARRALCSSGGAGGSGSGRIHPSIHPRSRMDRSGRGRRLVSLPGHGAVLVGQSCGRSVRLSGSPSCSPQHSLRAYAVDVRCLFYLLLAQLPLRLRQSAPLQPPPPAPPGARTRLLLPLPAGFASRSGSSRSSTRMV